MEINTTIASISVQLAEYNKFIIVIMGCFLALAINFIQDKA